MEDIETLWASNSRMMEATMKVVELYQVIMGTEECEGQEAWSTEENRLNH